MIFFAVQDEELKIAFMKDHFERSEIISWDTTRHFVYMTYIHTHLWFVLFMHTYFPIAFIENGYYSPHCLENYVSEWKWEHQQSNVC